MYIYGLKQGVYNKTFDVSFGDKNATGSLLNFFKNNRKSNLNYKDYFNANSCSTIKKNNILFVSKLLNSYKYVGLNKTTGFFTNTNYFTVVEYLQIYFFKGTSNNNKFRVVNNTLLGVFTKLGAHYAKFFSNVLLYVVYAIIVLYIFIYISVSFSNLLPSIFSLNVNSLLGLLFFLLSNNYIGGSIYSGNFIQNYIKLVVLSGYNNTKINSNFSLEEDKAFLSKSENSYYMGKKYGAN